jgi:aspartyl protease family protein
MVASWVRHVAFCHIGGGGRLFSGLDNAGPGVEVRFERTRKARSGGARAGQSECRVKSTVAASDAAEASIDADHGGQYATEVYIDGVAVKMLIDTGATMVVISHDTAARLSLQILDSDYTGRVQTANGVAPVAPVTLREVTLGSIYLGNVQALVAAPGAGALNLLGMSFLKRLASVEQRSGKLVLRQ